MIQELEEYLVEKGWAEDIAEDISEAYRLKGVSGVSEFSLSITDVDRDYVDEIVSMVNEWEKEVGETGFWICKERMYVIRH